MSEEQPQISETEQHQVSCNEREETVDQDTKKQTASEPDEKEQEKNDAAVTQDSSNETERRKETESIENEQPKPEAATKENVEESTENQRPEGNANTSNADEEKVEIKDAKTNSTDFSRVEKTIDESSVQEETEPAHQDACKVDDEIKADLKVRNTEIGGGKMKENGETAEKKRSIPREFRDDQGTGSQEEVFEDCNEEKVMDEDEEDAQLDDDELVDSPAYVPKSGRYYMHDTRKIEEKMYEPPRSRADGKWAHDKFDERLQRPKSKRELINKYGFDIREQNTEEATNQGRVGDMELPAGTPEGKAVKTERSREIETAKEGPWPARGRGGGPPPRQNAHYSQRGGMTVITTPQRGTRVVRTSSYTNSQRGGPMVGRGGENDRVPSYGSGGGRNDERRVRGRSSGGSGGVSSGHSDPSQRGAGSGGAQHTGGGKRYSTQRLATYADHSHVAPAATVQHQHQQQQQQAPLLAAAAVSAAAGEWHPAATASFQQPPPPPPPQATLPPPTMQPPPTANFRVMPGSDIVYFDPQQQMIRNTAPPPPRAKKRLQIVPPNQTTAASTK